jgi:RND family efflux transporter MFP subunit
MANDLELARKELARVKNLYDKNKVGYVASVEASERAVNTAAEKLALIEQSIKRAKINLDRCRIYAPFTCRIISHHVEEDQYVTPGMQVAVLADDSILEVELPLYGKDGVRWLGLNNEKPSKSNWFGSPEKVDITLNWTEEPNVFFRARLNRIASYTPETRSMTVVAQVSPGSQNNPFQLVPGMFVRATIPGKTMSGVIELPRSAVSFENRALVIRNNRLYSTDVEVIRIQNDHAYITGGVDEGDTVITTRLADPLEGSLVEIVKLTKGAPK